MSFTETPLTGAWVYEPRVFDDARGYFYESYNQNVFAEVGINCNFVQDNQSYSQYGTTRGLHFQKGEYAQSKLVRVLKGKVLDVIVDIRKDSKTFGKSFAVELSEDNHRQLFVPKGFAHGFSVLSDDAIFVYKCDNFYNKESEGGIPFNDETLAIDWRVPKDAITSVERDATWPSFAEYKEAPCF